MKTQAFSNDLGQVVSVSQAIAAESVAKEVWVMATHIDFGEKFAQAMIKNLKRGAIYRLLLLGPRVQSQARYLGKEFGENCSVGAEQASKQISVAWSSNLPTLPCRRLAIFDPNEYFDCLGGTLSFCQESLVLQVKVGLIRPAGVHFIQLWSQSEVIASGTEVPEFNTNAWISPVDHDVY